MTDNIRDLIEPEPKVKKTFSLLAVFSFLTGILAYLIYLFPLLSDFKLIFAVILSPISALIAIITGHKARKKMRNKEALVKGKGFANIGLMLGYIYFALAIIALALVIAGASSILKLVGGLFS
jgi:hypothetical protein